MYEHMFVVIVVTKIKFKIMTKTLYEKQKEVVIFSIYALFLVVVYVVSKIHLLSQFRIIIILI
jgi:hypothetical protein